MQINLITSYLRAFYYILVIFLYGISSAYAITPEEIAIPRLVELSEIPTQDSLDEIIALANEGSSNELRHQFIFTALIRIGPSNTGDQYAKDVLDNDTSTAASIGGALAYLSTHPDPSMTVYASKYLNTSHPDEARAMAAYLAGTLNMTDKIDIIKSIINTVSNGELRLHAAYGLAKLLPESEYINFIDATDLTQWYKTLAKQYNEFIQADEAKKNIIVGQLIRRSEVELSLLALKYILDTENTELLKQYIVTGDNNSVTVYSTVLKTFIRILGYEITGNINDIVVTKKPLL